MRDLYPLVTIGIPTFNRATSLEVSVRSALAQTYPNFEVLISDNHSSDDTELLCRQFAESEQQFRYVRQERNVGSSSNFEAVLKLARGEYFMWLSDDDWIEPNYVERCIDLLQTVPGAQIVSGSCLYYRGSQPPFEGERFTLNQDDPGERMLAYYRAVGYNAIFYGLSRTSTLSAQLPLRQCFGEDWLVVAALAARGAVLTTDSTWIHRSAHGMSSDTRHLTWNVIGFNRRVFVHSWRHHPSRNPMVALRCASAVGSRTTIPLVRIAIKTATVGAARRILSPRMFERLMMRYRNTPALTRMNRVQGWWR